MLTVHSLVTRTEFAVAHVECQADRAGWTAEDVRADYRIVLVRQGRFRRRFRGVHADLDPTMAYIGVPGEEEYLAHPAGGDI